MIESNARALEQKITGLVQRLLVERSINRIVAVDEDLRLAGLSSLDMVSLVLTVEEECGVMVPEAGITPANFRTIAAISRLVESLKATT